MQETDQPVGRSERETAQLSSTEKAPQLTPARYTQRHRVERQHSLRLSPWARANRNVLHPFLSGKAALYHGSGRHGSATPHTSAPGPLLLQNATCLSFQARALQGSK